jgi:hypothetical protein
VWPAVSRRKFCTSEILASLASLRVKNAGCNEDFAAESAQL